MVKLLGSISKSLLLFNFLSVERRHCLNVRNTKLEVQEIGNMLVRLLKKKSRKRAGRRGLNLFLAILGLLRGLCLLQF